MHTIHVLLSAASALVLVAAAWPNSRLAAGQSQGRLIALIATAAALVGNLASLLPATPAWYDLGVALATVGVLAWVVRSSIGGSARDADSVVGDLAAPGPRGAHATRPVARAAARRVRSAPSAAGGASAHYGDASPRIVDAEIVEDAADASDSTAGSPAGSAATRVAPVASLAAQRAKRMPFATQETFAQAGPAGSEATVGSTYVAGNLTDYLPQRPRGARLARPAHEVHAARAARAARAGRAAGASGATDATGATTGPTGPTYADLRQQLLEAYGDGAERRGRVTSVKA